MGTKGLRVPNLTMGSEVPSPFLPLPGLRTPAVMGILNITPDSFSDGGKFLKADDACRRAEKMIHQGADIIDIGGESTRPGSRPVELSEELQRVIPVLRSLRREFDVPISIDTTRSTVARTAVEEYGADMINDISALRFDPEMAPLAARLGVPVVLMHMKGIPRNMQSNPTYTDVMKEIRDFLEERVGAARNAGIRREHILLDPGIGFGKRFEDNITIISRLKELTEIGYPLLVGLSRKRFIERITGEKIPARREAETITADIIALLQGASVIRVHDVESARRSIQTLQALGAI